MKRIKIICIAVILTFGGFTAIQAQTSDPVVTRLERIPKGLQGIWMMHGFQRTGGEYRSVGSVPRKLADVSDNHIAMADSNDEFIISDIGKTVLNGKHTLLIMFGPSLVWGLQDLGEGGKMVIFVIIDNEVKSKMVISLIKRD